MHHRFFTAPAGLLLGITLIGFSPSFFLKFVFEHPGGIVEQAELLRRYNQFWFAHGTTVAGTRRTSLIVDPPAGRLPPYTREGEARMAAREEARRRNAGPEDRDVDERRGRESDSGRVAST